MGNRASPSVRCNYPTHTSAVYSRSCIPTVRSYTQYNLSSILQFFLHTRCSHTGTDILLDNPRNLKCNPQTLPFKVSQQCTASAESCDWVQAYTIISQTCSFGLTDLDDHTHTPPLSRSPRKTPTAYP
jgi:hypothetical protein